MVVAIAKSRPHKTSTSSRGTFTRDRPYDTRASTRVITSTNSNTRASTRACELGLVN